MVVNGLLPKPNHFSKSMSNSYVTLKVTQSYIFRFKFGLGNSKVILKRYSKKIIISKIFKTSYFRLSKDILRQNATYNPANKTVNNI